MMHVLKFVFLHLHYFTTISNIVGGGQSGSNQDGNNASFLSWMNQGSGPSNQDSQWSRPSQNQDKAFLKYD